MNSINAASLLLLALVSSTSVIGQKVTLPCATEVGSVEDSKSMKDWKRVSAARASICVPSDVRFEKTRGIDINSWEYSGPEFSIKMYVGFNAPTVDARTQNLASYSQASAWVNGLPALVSKYLDDRGEFRNVFVGRIKRENTKDSYAATIIIKSAKPAETFGEKLIGTLLFDSVPPVK